MKHGKYWFRFLDWIDAPHTQNFEIFKSPEQNQEKNKNGFDFFEKIVEGLIFG
jgi:hypothetical protein